MITTAYNHTPETLFGTAKQTISQGFKYLANILTSVARFVGRIAQPAQNMNQAPTNTRLANIQDTASQDFPNKFGQRNPALTTLRGMQPDPTTSDITTTNAITPANTRSQKPNLYLLPTQPTTSETAPQEPLTETTDTAQVPPCSAPQTEDSLVPALPTEDSLPTQSPTAPLDDVNDLALTTVDTSNAETTEATPPATSTRNKREKIVLCERDAGKSPHFVTSAPKVLRNFMAKVATAYDLAQPIAAEDANQDDTQKSDAVLTSLFETLIDNLCEPWAHNDTMICWKLHHVENAPPLHPVDQAFLELDEQSPTPEIARHTKAGDGIFTTDKKRYQAIIKALSDQLRQLAPNNTDAIDRLQDDMADPNFWRDLVIEAPTVGKPSGADRSMFNILANTVKSYYSYDVVGEGLEDIKAQVEAKKPFLTTVHHSAHTVEITALQHCLDHQIKSWQPDDTPYNNDVTVRTLTHATFHEQKPFQRIMDGSGCATATQNVSRSILSNKTAQGIICATGGTPEAKRPAEKRHETHWLTHKGTQRNGLATLSIETQTPVSVATCVNADELFDVKPNDVTEKIYKETRKSAIDAVNKLGSDFFLQLGKPWPTNIIFSAPLPLKHHMSPLITPPPALNPDDFETRDAFEQANKSLTTAFSHHLESHQQDQIFFDLAFTHRDDLGSRRKTQYLIYSMLLAMIKSEGEDIKTGHGIIDGPVEDLREKYQQFRASQKAAGLPDSHNHTLSAALLREVFQLADVYQYPTDFFSKTCCKNAYTDALARIEKFERHISPQERATQKSWFDVFSSNSLSATLMRNRQYFGAGLPNNAYLLKHLLYGLLKKSIFE